MIRTRMSFSLAVASSQWALRLLPVLLLTLVLALFGSALPVSAAGTPPTITAIANQFINMGTSTSALAFTVGDSVTPAASLAMTAASSNTALVHTDGLVLTGPNASGVCSLTVTPMATYSGFTTISLTVKNGAGLATKTTFTLTVNGKPTITAIANQTLTFGTVATTALPLTIGDDLTAPDALTLTGDSSNTTFVPAANIVFDGSGAARTVTVTPAAGKSGTSTITLTVTDSGGLTATKSFVLSMNAPPTISAIADQSIKIGATPSALAFTVGDDLTAVSALTVTGASSNTTLIPVVNIVFSGTTSARTVKVTPAPGKSGIATITLTVKDGGGLTATTSFLLTVNAPPSVTAIANQLINMGTSTTALAFTVSDDLTPANALTVTCASSNTALVHADGIALTGPNVDGVCSLTLTPVAVYSGVTTITLSVKDGSGLITKATFTLTVNKRPTITAVANQLTNPGVATPAQTFTIGDDLTDVAALTLSGSSSNSTLAPNANIFFGGSGAARTVKVTPASGKNGKSTITLTVTDGGGLSATTSFVLTVNAPPSITALDNQIINLGTSTTALAFTVSDDLTPATSLTVTSASSNTALVHTDGMVLTGPNATGVCSLTVTPVASYSGVTIMTLTVTDSGALTTKTTFSLTVNKPPSITAIANQTIAMGTATAALAFTVGDDLTAPTGLTVTGSSSNTTLIPTANIACSGTGAIRTVTVTPATAQSGVSTITLTVTDGNSFASTTSFLVTVNAPPTITAIADVTINMNKATAVLPFTVADDFTAVTALTVTGVSSNTTLVPTGNIVFSGTGAARAVKVTPVTGHSGTVTITLTVKDSGSLTATSKFILTVNGPPTISAIATQVISMGADTFPVAFTVGDDLTPAASLLVTVSSSDTVLQPNAYITLSGTGASRTVQVNPVLGKAGASIITLTVTDSGGLTSTTSFVMTVPTQNYMDNAPMVWVPYGSFTMGTTFGATWDAPTTQPVTLSGYWIYQSEVTVWQYLRFCTLTGHALPPWPGNGYSWLAMTGWNDPALQRHPIVNVTWDDAQAYAAWAKVSLPTEAQWEYAARGPKGNNYPWGGTATAADPTNGWDDTLCANIDNSYNQSISTWPIGSFTGDTSWCEALDLAGNVSEWCADWYSDYSSSAVTNPTGPISGTDRVLRGGAWDNGSGGNIMRGANRNYGFSGDYWDDTGFRCVTRVLYVPPTITPIADQTTYVGKPTSALPFTVGDSVTPAASLIVTGASSNATLLPAANIVFGGSGAARTVTVTPKSFQHGTATITLTVKDAAGYTASTSFLLTVAVAHNAVDGEEMLWVPGGSFTMGSADGANEYTLAPYTQQVTLSGYWIYKNPVTVLQYLSFCEATGHALPPFPTPLNDSNYQLSSFSWTGYTDWTAPELQQMPIVNVGWADAVAYAAWAGVQLPTEAQYEYAARGPQGNNYPWGGTATASDVNNGWDPMKCANYTNSFNLDISTWVVGCFPAGASWCGAQDMAGNVWEWCSDLYGAYSTSPVTNPTGPTVGDLHVSRGGSWYKWTGGIAECFRGAYRACDSNESIILEPYEGFRCASMSPNP